jgi:histidinol-phosphate/aromatic aminotransferase/cobyric acid decarboxylase-like protein
VTLSVDVHGGDGRMRARAAGLDPADVLDLSVSLNPFAPDLTPLVTDLVSRGALSEYADAHDVGVATRALAAALDVAAERVLLTNGGAEAIALVASEVRTGWVVGPEFSLYGRHLAALDPAAPRFRSDPNNPTGALAGPAETAGVWDEAFYPLATGRWHGGRDAAVAVGSLTKVFACPGLRVGYVVVPADDGAALGVSGLHALLARRQPAWSVSTLALRMVPRVLEGADVPGWARRLTAAREGLVALLGAHGLVTRPSAANYVLVEQATEMAVALGAQGIVVRDAGSFGLEGAARVAVPDARGLARVATALEALG